MEGQHMSKQYETVIGLEVHVELATKSKIFCGCSTEFGGAPNAHTCPVCTGMPGSLPVLNKKVVEYATAVGLATNCSITQYCKFDRKNYFYPDNPQNYQISQLYLPICRDGYVTIKSNGKNKNIRIHEIHMEEDAGKLIHDPLTGNTLVDCNRSGVPLIEIVSEPDMRSAEEVIAYLEKLRMTIQYLGVSDCKLQEGSMRADVNISVREFGSEAFGTRTEMKNLNSFSAISRAIDSETERQIDLLESGEQVIQESRRWDDDKEYSYSMRSKEDAKDYRYFPEPDLPPIWISDEWLEQIKSQQPEFQEQKCKRYADAYGLPEYDIDIITSDKKLADFFEACVALGAPAKEVSNLIMGDISRLLNENGKTAADLQLSPEHVVKMIQMIENNVINRKIAKEVFEAVFYDDADPERYVEEHDLKTISDEGELRSLIKEIVENNPKSVADYKAGKKKAIGFLVGQVMRVMKGKADTKLVNSILSELLDE
jgi:aspartyl-tRNA(Asn)/glutamyl-tRNA(Gln) amidotransferase subunit B